MSKAELPTPIKGDVEDLVLARLEQAEVALQDAGVEMTRAIRDQAEAAILMARRQRLSRVGLRAGTLRLWAEARLGELHPETPREETGKLGGRPLGERSGHVPIPLSPEQAEAERIRKREIEERARWRRVAAAKDFIRGYSERCADANEDVTRVGFLAFAKKSLEHVIDESEESDEGEVDEKKAREGRAHRGRAKNAKQTDRLALAIEKVEDATSFVDDALGYELDPDTLETKTPAGKLLAQILGHLKKANDLTKPLSKLAGLSFMGSPTAVSDGG